MSHSPTCSYCQTAFVEGDARSACPECGAEYHGECWEENGGCAVYGCKQTPATEARTELEIPVSWWGREQKPCPSCGKEILAAALRCRHCGATFASARPEDSNEFQQRSRVLAEHGGLRARVVWQFVLSVVPLTAPIGAVMGLAWYLPNRPKVATLRPAYQALGRLALIASLAQVAVLTIVAVLYAIFR